MKPRTLINWLDTAESKGLSSTDELRVIAYLFAHGDKTLPELTTEAGLDQQAIFSVKNKGLVGMYLLSKPRRIKGHGKEEFQYQLTPDAYALIDGLEV